MLDQSVFTETIHEVADIKRGNLELFQRDGVKRAAGKYGFRVPSDTT